MLSERRFLKFHFKEVTSLSLVLSYIVILLKCCLVLLVLALAKLCFNLVKISVVLVKYDFTCMEVSL
jgi:hypothetical protein